MATAAAAPLVKLAMADDGLLAPIRATPGSAGLDIRAAHSGEVPARGSELVGTGMQITLPHGTVGLLKSRSGLALRFGIEVGAGVIDSDYSGEVKVLLRNHSDVSFSFQRNDRIAQLVVLPILLPNLHVVWKAPERSEGGRGDTDTPDLTSVRSEGVWQPVASPLSPPSAVTFGLGGECGAEEGECEHGEEMGELGEEMGELGEELGEEMGELGEFDDEDDMAFEMLADEWEEQEEQVPLPRGTRGSGGFGSSGMS